MGIETIIGLIAVSAAAFASEQVVQSAVGADSIYGEGYRNMDNGSSPAAAAPADTKNVGNVGDVGSIEQQAATRRLARMSKYFTSPTGVMGETTGSSGVF